MGNATSSKAVASSDHGSQESFDIELNGILWQCQAFLSSIEHQTAAALSASETNSGTLNFLQHHFHSPADQHASEATFAVDQLLRTQVAITEQLKGLQSAGESFKHMMQPLKNGIYPINVKLHNDETLREKDNYIAELNQELASLKSKVRVLENEVTEKTQLLRRNEALLTHTDELKRQIESIKKVSDHHQREKDKATQENETIRKSNKTLKDEKAVLQEQINTIRRQNYLLEQQNSNNARRAEDLRRQMEIQRQRKITVNVQLFSPRKGDLTSAVLQEMTAMLETQFVVENKHLVVSICDNCSDVNPDKPVLILCINASRLGSDVESALQGLSLNKRQGLIILHHKDTHALPNQPSERLLTSSTSDYKKLGGIFDMAFLSGKGIYPCDMNNRAVSELVNFIKTLSLLE